MQSKLLHTFNLKYVINLEIIKKNPICLKAHNTLNVSQTTNKQISIFDCSQIFQETENRRRRRRRRPCRWWLNN